MVNLNMLPSKPFFMLLLKDVQEQYADYDPDEKVKELFKGDRRFMENR